MRTVMTSMALHHDHHDDDSPADVMTLWPCIMIIMTTTHLRT